MRISIISSNTASWGGSEELWRGAALALKSRGHEVSVTLARPPLPHPRVDTLESLGVGVVSWDPQVRKLSERVWNRLAPDSMRLPAGWQLGRRLRNFLPDFALVSMGGLIEDLTWVRQCFAAGVPYAVLLHQASEIDVPGGVGTAEAASMLEHAFAVFFVSEANRTVVREQLGIPLPNAYVVRNPVMVDAAAPFPWPEGEEPLWHLACPARLVPRDKGQDILVRVLAHPKWRERPLRVTLYGSGRHEDSLRRMVSYLRVDSVRFGGHAEIAEVWRRHPACVLPSRVEGLPLALVEAMWCGRPAIVTPAGGSAEVVRDGVTGFVARAITVDDLDEALERAWQRRCDWQMMGLAAARKIRELVPPDPAGVFAELLMEVFRASRG